MLSAGTLSPTNEGSVKGQVSNGENIVKSRRTYNRCRGFEGQALVSDEGPNQEEARVRLVKTCAKSLRGEDNVRYLFDMYRACSVPIDLLRLSIVSRSS